MYLSGNVGVRRREEVRAIPEFRVALGAQPVVAVGGAGMMVFKVQAAPIRT